MARVLITGSADGLGQLAAKTLVKQGHAVVIHARNESRGQQAVDKVPDAETVVTGDLNLHQGPARRRKPTPRDKKLKSCPRNQTKRPASSGPFCYAACESRF